MIASLQREREREKEREREYVCVWEGEGLQVPVSTFRVVRNVVLNA